MKPPHLLKAAPNVRRMKENLIGIVDPTGISGIEQEILRNVSQLFSLGRQHFYFARRQHNRHWRQKVSRLYYGAYNASRAIRLLVTGDFSTDSTDHKKIEDLPRDFPNKNTYTNRLAALREDRNVSDYDHTAQITELVITVSEATNLVESFLKDTHAYLSSRGARI